MKYHVWAEGCQMNVADALKLGNKNPPVMADFWIYGANLTCLILVWGNRVIHVDTDCGRSNFREDMSGFI